jgi:hypothetical protein
MGKKLSFLNLTIEINNLNYLHLKQIEIYKTLKLVLRVVNS